MNAFLHRAAPQADLRHGGLGGGKPNALFRKSGVSLGRLHSGLLDLPGSLVRSLAQLFQPLCIGNQLVAAFFDPLGLFLQFLPLPGDFPVDGLIGFLRFADLLLQPLHIPAVVLDIVFQKVDLTLGAHSLFVQRRRFPAHLLHLSGAAARFPEILFDPGGDLLHFPFDLLVPCFCQGDFFLVLPQGFSGAVQGFQPNADLQTLLFLIVGNKFFRLFRLNAQGLYPFLQLAQNIPEAHQVFLGLLKPALRFLLAVAVAGNARRLLENLPAVLGPGGYNAVDLALPYDGIAVSSQARIHKQLVYVPQAHRGLVDEILAFPGAVIPPGDRHRIIVKGQPPVSVIDGQRDLRVAHGLSHGSAAEDHVLHFRASQGTDRLFPQHPPNGVADIAFSAAVGPHHRGDPLLKGQGGFIREGLKPLQLQRFQYHMLSPVLCSLDPFSMRNPFRSTLPS